MKINIKPLGARLLCKQISEPEYKKGSIIIPDTAKEKPTEMIVVAIGTGRVDNKGKRTEFEVQINDRILVGKYAGTDIKIDGEEYKIFNSDDVLAIITQ